MHEIKIDSKSIRTDLLIDEEEFNNSNNQDNISVNKCCKNNKKYSTLSFKDITDKDNFNNVLEKFVKELKSFIKVKKNEKYLIIGLGNDKSTPDSLGPLVINNILVTSYLFSFGEVEDGYSNVCVFKPNVFGNTGIETSEVIKSIIKTVSATTVIIIDSLKTNNMNRLVKTIQITNNGISPGSGVGNNRLEISNKTMDVCVYAIGVPTVIDISSMLNNKNSDNYIVTPTDIDYLIEKLSLLISKGINITLHKNYIRQNNY